MLRDAEAVFVLPAWRGPVRTTAGNSTAAFLRTGSSERLMYVLHITGNYAIEMQNFDPINSCVYVVLCATKIRTVEQTVGLHDENSLGWNLEIFFPTHAPRN